MRQAIMNLLLGFVAQANACDALDFVQNLVEREVDMLAGITFKLSSLHLPASQLRGLRAQYLPVFAAAEHPGLVGLFGGTRGVGRKKIDKPKMAAFHKASFVGSIAQSRGARSAIRAVTETSVASKQMSVTTPLPSVLICPGFLQGAAAYDEMKSRLLQLGVPQVEVAAVQSPDWWPTFFGRPFDRILSAIDAAAGRITSQTFAIIGHSAGGWLARIWMSNATYNGRVYGGAARVVQLITLGTPHQSDEAYVFGRVREQRQGEQDELLCDESRASTLKFCNKLLPGAFEGGVRYVTVVGTGVKGKPWNSSTPFDLDGVIEYSSYMANAGTGDEDGDGVTPVCCAHLDGALQVALPGIKHLPPGPWYGSAPGVDQWVQYLRGEPNGKANNSDVPLLARVSLSTLPNTAGLVGKRHADLSGNVYRLYAAVVVVMVLIWVKLCTSHVRWRKGIFQAPFFN